MGFKYYEDPILGKGRAQVTGGTGGGGATYYAGDGLNLTGTTFSTSPSLTDLADGTGSVSKQVKNAREVQGVSAQNTLTLVHLSDVHNDSAALDRIIADGDAMGALVDDFISTGDQINAYSEITSLSDWWIPKVMTCIGNHDARDANNDPISMADRISYFISPFESNWGITRGEGVDYYYKDYTTQGVRLIVIDNELYKFASLSTDATAQTTWLAGLLESAKTAGLHVLIACHAPALTSTVVQCAFSKYASAYEPDNISYIPEDVTNAVANAVSGGLTFIGYICGHTHQDFILNATGASPIQQFMFCVTHAWTTGVAISNHHSDQYRDASGDYDAFNLITIDTANTLVKITRGGGANMDNHTRKRQSLTINYSTGELVENAASPAKWIPFTTLTGTTVTIGPGEAYYIKGSTTIKSVTLPSGQCGAESTAVIAIGAPNTILTAPNVIFLNQLVPYAENSCTIRFFNGYARIRVDDHFSGYSVTVNAASGEHTLSYALGSAPNHYVFFDCSLDGQQFDLGGAVTNDYKVVVGNGFERTFISGAVSCSSKTVFSNLSLQNAAVTGGTMTLGYVAIPSGSTVAVSGGGLAVENIMGSGGTIDLRGTQLNCSYGATRYFEGVTIVGGSSAGGAVYVSNCKTTLSGCIVSGNSIASSAEIAGLSVRGGGGSLTIISSLVTGNYGGGYVGFSNYGAYAMISGSTITNNSAAGTVAGAVMFREGTTYLKDSIISANTAGKSAHMTDMLAFSSGATFELLGGNTIGQVAVNAGGIVRIAGSNNIAAISPRSNGAVGTVTISSGASINLTSSINPGGSITVLDGGCTVNGNAIAAGTYTSIDSTGTPT